MRDAENHRDHGNTDSAADPRRADGEHLEAVEADEFAVLIRVDQQEHDGKDANDVADAGSDVFRQATTGLRPGFRSPPAGRLSGRFTTRRTRSRFVRHLPATSCT